MGRRVRGRAGLERVHRLHTRENQNPVSMTSLFGKQQGVFPREFAVDKDDVFISPELIIILGLR